MANITRRDLVKGAAVVGAGSAALGTTGGVALADEQATTGEGYLEALLPENADFENRIMSLFPSAQPIAAAEAPEQWDEEYDAVVIGSGSGGCAAAVRLAENGLSVCLIEKQVWVGGNSSYSSYFKCYGGTKAHVAAGLPDYDTYVETMVPAILETWFDGYGEESASRSFQRTVLLDEPKSMDWLIDLGCDLELDYNFSTGEDEASGQGSGSKLMYKDPDTDITACRHSLTLKFLEDKANELGVVFHLGTEAKRLVADGGKVIGLMVDGDDGALSIKANQGVIMAAGGCLDNRDMLSVFSPNVARAAGCSMTNGSDTGNCIRMGMGMGAAVCGRDAFIGNDAGPAWEIHGSWNVNLYSGWPQVGGQPWMMCDRYGELLPYYSTTTLGEIGNFRQARCEMGRQGYRSYKIFDGKYKDMMPAFHELTWRIPLTKDMPGMDRFPTLVDWETGMEDGVKYGLVPVGDTLEELAEKLRIPYESVQKAVDEWNALCEKGEGAADLGFPPEWMQPIDTPPYYGFALAAFACTTGFGLRVDNDMRVMSAETDKPIEGLYAAYHTAGGWGEDTWMMGSIINQMALSFWSGWRAANTLLGLN